MNQEFKTSFHLTLKNAFQIFKKRGLVILWFLFPSAVFIGRFYHCFMWQMVIGLVVCLIGLEFFLTGFSVMQHRYFKRILMIYLALFTCLAIIMRYTWWPFLTRYAWASIYHFLELFGKTLFVDDYVVVGFLALVYCFFLCDLIVKGALLIMINKIKRVFLGHYLIGLHIMFLIFSFLVFFTNARSFYDFQILSWFVIIIVCYLWIALYEWQSKCGFTIKQIVGK